VRHEDPISCLLHTLVVLKRYKQGVLAVELILSASHVKNSYLEKVRHSISDLRDLRILFAASVPFLHSYPHGYTRARL